LLPRLYSISSSPAAHLGAVHDDRIGSFATARTIVTAEGFVRHCSPTESSLVTSYNYIQPKEISFCRKTLPRR